MALKIAVHYILVFLFTTLAYGITAVIHSETIFNIIQIIFYAVIFSGLFYFEIGIQKNTLWEGFKRQLSDTYFLVSLLLSGIVFLLLVIGTRSPIAYVQGSFHLGYIFYYVYRNLIFAAFVEEFIFRNCYLKELSKKYAFFLSSIIVSFLWVFLHLPSYIFQGFAIMDILFYLLTGMIKGILLAYMMKLFHNVFINTLFHFNMGYTSEIGFLILLPVIFLKLNEKVFGNKKQETLLK